MMARARRVAATMSRPRMRCLTRPILDGAIERSRIPRPSSSGVKRGSPAISPHRLTGMRARSAASTANWMQRIIEMRHLLVAAIDGKRVLDEVVGADGEEIGLGGERVGGERRARNLD